MNYNITFLSNFTKIDQVRSILTLAYRNSHDLMKRETDVNHPMFALHRAVCLSELAIMMKEDFRERLGTGAVVATDQDRIVGFIIFTQANDCASACGANYICVDEHFRKQGVMRSMLDLLKSKYTHIALGCAIEKVPLYERLGFTIKGPQGAQVAMRIGDDYNMNMPTQAYIHSQPQVELEIRTLIQRFGNGVAKIEADYEAATKRLHQDVAHYVAGRQVR